MATFTERLELLISATSTGAQNELKKVAGETENLSTSQKGLKVASDGVKNALTNLGVPAEATGTALKVAAVGAGALAAVKVGEWAYGAADAFSSMTSEVRGFQRVAGTSAEDSSRLVFAVKELGISPDAAASAFGRFATRLGTGKVNLDDYGVAVAKNKDGTTDLAGTVANLSEAYQNTEDPIKRAALANAAFGRSWQTLAPLLGKGADQLNEIFKFADTTHQVFSQEDLERGRQFTAATKELHAAFEGLKIEVGQAVAPAFTSATQTATGFLTGIDSLTSSVGGLGKAGGLVFDASPFENAASLVSSASDLMQGHFADAGKEFLQSIPVIGNVASVLDDTTGFLGFGSDATQTYSDKQKDLQGSLQKVLDLHTAGKTGTAEYRQAVQDAQSASDSFAKTNADVATSLQSVAQQEAAATDQHLAMATASLNVEGAMLNVGSSLTAEAQAQKDANDAAQVGVDKSADVEAAHIKVEQAVLAVVAAAQARAVQALGPGASSEDVAKAKVDATQSALAYLASTTPAATKAIQDLGYVIVILPDGKHIVVTADVSDAIAKLNSLKQFIPTVPGLGTLIGVAQIPGASGRSVAPPSNAVAPEVVVPLGVEAMMAPMAVAATRPTPMAAPSQSLTFNVNVVTRGLGADAPEIQRAVVDAIRGYVDRNGRLEGVTR